MFFSTDLLLPGEKRKLAIIWLASILTETEFKQKHGKREIMAVDIVIVSEEINEIMQKKSDDPREQFSLYLSSQLVLGMTIIHKYQMKYRKDDIVKHRKYVQRMMKDLHKVPSNDTDSGIEHIEIPADVPDVDLNLSDFRDVPDIHRIDEPSVSLQRTHLSGLDVNFGQVKVDEVVRLFRDQSLHEADASSVRALPYEKEISTRSDIPLVSIEDIDDTGRQSPVSDLNFKLPGTPQKRAATRELVTGGTPVKRKRIIESLQDANIAEPREEARENLETLQFPLEHPSIEGVSQLGGGEHEERTKEAPEGPRRPLVFSVTLESLPPEVLPSRKVKKVKKPGSKAKEISIDLKNLNIRTVDANAISWNNPEYLLESAKQLKTIQNFPGQIIGSRWQAAIDENDLLFGLRSRFESKPTREETAEDSVDILEDIARDVTAGISLDPSSLSALANIGESTGVEGDKTLATINEGEAIPVPKDLAQIAPELPPGELSEVRDEPDILIPVEVEFMEIEDKLVETSPTHARSLPRDLRAPVERISESHRGKKDFEAELASLFSGKRRVKFSEIVPPEYNSVIDAIVCSGYVAELYEENKIDIIQENLITSELELEKFSGDV